MVGTIYFLIALQCLILEEDTAGEDTEMVKEKEPSFELVTWQKA